MFHSITVRVRSLRHLPQQFFVEEKVKELALSKATGGLRHRATQGPQRRCLRAQANIGDDTKDTGNSVWGKGVRSREALWLRGADTLSWRLSEQQFKHVKAYTPVCKVHVYATDANNPRMENSDSVGWFTVDVRDLAGQRLRDERWVKLQGANPAEILISSTLAMVREGEEGKSRDEPSVQSLSQASSPCSVSSSRAEAECMMPSEVQPTETAQPYASLMTLPGTGTVSELDALPVGPGADGLDARTFSLGIMIKGAARLLQLAPQLDGTGFGFWFSYSVFGVVVQTDRFERLAPPAGNGPVVEPMMDSFRMRATLPGLCDFLNEAPPLQVYLCTERRILGHADIDMSLLLPRNDWESQTISDFGRTAMEGDFKIHPPGELPTQHGDGDCSIEYEGKCPVVTVCARLSIAEATCGESSSEWSDVADTSGMTTQSADEYARGIEGRTRKAGTRVRTWTRAPTTVSAGDQRAIIATLPRLDVRTSSIATGVLRDERNTDNHGGNVVLVAIQRGDDDTADCMSSPGSFGMVPLDKRGDIATGDPSTLSTIRWIWGGHLPRDPREHELEREARSWAYTREDDALARVKLFHPGSKEEVASGDIPWPSSLRSGSRQLVNVQLATTEGSQIGSCCVCLEVTSAKTVRHIAEDNVSRTPVPGSSSSFSRKKEQIKREKKEEESRDVFPIESPNISPIETPPERRDVTENKSMQVEESRLERMRDAANGRIPRCYRLSVNLASVKDLENAAHVVACYHYPHFGTLTPVRTAIVWAPPRNDTPLANACCTFSFGMSPDRLGAIVQEHPLVVSVRNRDRFEEREVGLVKLPLAELVESAPRFFRCRESSKTFTSMASFRAHLKSRQRPGEVSATASSQATPVEVRVLDRYLTVVSSKEIASDTERETTELPRRLCSMRVMLLLEDMGPTGDSQDQALNDFAPTIEKGERAVESTPRVLPTSIPSPLARLARPLQGGIDVERVWNEWEQWQTKEEAAFAQRLREKDEALEEKWAARESARHRDLAQAQTNYGKLEGKLRKALSEVEARERALKAREGSWRADHAQKLSELQLLQRRLREETKHQVELERMKVKSLENQLAINVKALEDARSKVVAADEDFERFRQQHRRTSEGGLRQEVFRLSAAKAEAEAKVERERSEKHKAQLEKEEYRAHIHKLARALKRHQEREITCARREMEQLRLEYLAREERFMLDGDRSELRDIKQELNELRHLSLVQEAKGALSKPNAPDINPDSSPTRVYSTPEGIGGMVTSDPEPSPGPPPMPIPAPASTPTALLRRDRSTSPDGQAPRCDRGNKEGTRAHDRELWRLVEWRDELLATGMYTPHNPIVSELNRRIQSTRIAERASVVGLRRQE